MKAVPSVRLRAALVLLGLVTFLALIAVGAQARATGNRIAIVNDDSGGDTTPVPGRPAFIYPWAGFRSLFSVSGFKQAATDTRSIVENAIAHISINTISGSVGTPIGISIDYDLYNIRLSQWQFGPLSVQVVADPAALDGIIRIQLSQISFRVDLDFHYSALFISGSGDATVNVILTMDIDIVALNHQGEPEIYAGSVNPSLQRFDVSVHGGASWFYGVFVDLFKGKIKDVFLDAMKQQVTNAISSINTQYVSTFPIKMAVNDIVGINYGLVTEPVNPYIPSYGAVTDHVGRFYWLNGTFNCPFPSAEMIPDLEQLGDRNLQLLVHESFVTSLGCAYFAAGKLVLTLDKSSIPPNFPLPLNTSDWAFFLPGLYQKFPNAGMKFEVRATSPPVTTIGIKDLGEVMTFDAICYAILANGTNVPAFTLGIDVAIAFTAALAKGNLTADFTNFNISLSLMSSAIGGFDVTLLQTIAEFVMSDIFVPILNVYGERGIPLAYISSKSLTLSNVTLSFRPHYAVVSTNFNITLDATPPAALVDPVLSVIN